MQDAQHEALAAFRPNQPGGTPVVDYIKGMATFVVSRILEEPLEWNNSTLTKGNVAEEVSELKRSPARTYLSSAAVVS
jgi:hypothetical protein